MLRRATRRGLTLMELLVVVTIIGALMALLLPTVSTVRARAKGVRCMVNLRTMAFDFRLFADEFSTVPRGDSDRLAGNRFRLEDFVDSQYKVGEFWTGKQFETQTMSRSKESTMCPAAAAHLQRKAGRPCKGQAVTPLKNVSYAFNARLDREAVWFRGRLVMAPVQLTPRILENGNVPIAFDADGTEAARRNRLPYFSAPPGSLTDAYHNGEYWFPALRHRQRLNAAFTGGHVLTTPDPLRESAWNWEHRSTPLGRP